MGLEPFGVAFGGQVGVQASHIKPWDLLRVLSVPEISGLGSRTPAGPAHTGCEVPRSSGRREHRALPFIEATA